MSNWIALLLLAACSSAPAIELPNGSPGIGFDDLRFSARLHRVLVPGGRSGNLALLDPSTHAITTIGGFSTTTAAMTSPRRRSRRRRWPRPSARCTMS
jgi:hypothetical protein